MNAAPATAERVTEPAPRNPERAPLLGLVRKLIAYGRDMVATLQGRDAAAPPVGLARNFGTLSVALIIARITRGLMIAGVLESRLLRSPPPPAAPVERAAPKQPRAERRPRQPEIDEDAELRGQLPSAREIAARLRNRRTGAVLIALCRDLGINAMHPLWRDICRAITVTRGNMGTLLLAIQRRYVDAFALPLPPETYPGFEATLAAWAQPP